MIARFLKRFPHALRGILYALKHDFGFRTQFYTALFLSVAITYVFSPLKATEFLFLATAAMFVLITELQNSAIEVALDRLHPELHDTIKRSKDMAAGAVFLAGTYALLVIAIVAADRLVL